MCAFTGPRLSSESPSVRRPVPRSKMTFSPAQSTSTQEVLPPVSSVSGPGDARLPRTPQKRTVRLFRFLGGEGTKGDCRKNHGPARKGLVLQVTDWRSSDESGAGA